MHLTIRTFLAVRVGKMNIISRKSIAEKLFVSCRLTLVCACGMAGVADCQRRNVTHRDIKPANLIVHMVAPGEHVRSSRPAGAPSQLCWKTGRFGRMLLRKNKCCYMEVDSA